MLISGRDKDVLQEWFGALPVRVVAEHGIWLKEEGGGEWTLLKPQAHERKAHILPILQLYADRLPGAIVEEKDYSIVWHYRGADPEHGQTLAQELTDHLVNFTANIDIQVMRGHKVIEVRTTGVNKGVAAQHFPKKDAFDFILSTDHPRSAICRRPAWFAYTGSSCVGNQGISDAVRERGGGEGYSLESPHCIVGPLRRLSRGP